MKSEKRKVKIFMVLGLIGIKYRFFVSSFSRSFGIMFQVSCLICFAYSFFTVKHAMVCAFFAFVRLNQNKKLSALSG